MACDHEFEKLDNSRGLCDRVVTVHNLRVFPFLKNGVTVAERQDCMHQLYI